MADGRVIIDIEADSKDFENELEDVEKSAKSGADGLDDLEDSAKGAGKGLDTVDVAAGNLISNGLTALIGAITDTVASIIELADSTREYREDMAKLETAFTTAGHTTETASSAYEDFYAILGESDRSVEAVNHLAELTKNEKEVAKWSDIAAGVTAKFGDSLPIEGLTEAANETAKVGKVTGPLADALNWAGISEDAFNEKLAACNSEQERATLITETLNQKYQAAANEYNKLTSSTQAARRATSEMEAAQAEMGAAIEPITTAWTRLKTEGMQMLIPVVEWLSTKIQELTAWLREHETAATVIKGIIIALAVAFGVLAVALGIHTLIQTVTKAFNALNVTMLANPIVMIIAAIAALVAAFIYLWNNCEAFREFWINLWEKIKGACKAVADWFKKTWNDALTFIKNIWSTVTGFFSGIWTGIKNVFSAVGSWFRDKFTAAKENIVNAFSNIKEKFTDIKTKIFDAFSNIKEMFKEIGANILNGIRDGITAGWEKLKSFVKNLASSLFGAAKDELEIHSPSRKFAYIGEMSVEGIGEGWSDSIPDVEKKLTGDLSGLTARVQASVNSESMRAGQSMGRQETGFADLARAVGIQTAGISSLSAQYRKGAGTMRPVVLELNGRELGRTMVNVGGAEETRTGVKLSLGGAY